MKTTFSGKKDPRACGACKWCPAGVPHCAWRMGLYTKEMSPINTGIVLHPARIAGHNCFVAQPLRGAIDENAAFLVKTAEFNTVVLTSAPVHRGGVVCAIMAPSAEVGQQVADELHFAQPAEPLVEEITAE